MIFNFDDIINFFGEKYTQKMFEVWCSLQLEEDYNSMSPSIQKIVYENFKNDTIKIINEQRSE